MNLSVCIIAKDEEKHIENCLRSLVDKHVQIIVVDTGSQDDTKNIALKYTSCVYDYQWNDDFGAAKQFAVSKADNDNILILDCDEYLADQLFIKHKVPVKFGKEYRKNDSRYCVISCKIRKRYEEEFKKALAEMDNKMILRGYTDYADFCENFNTIIDKARCEL